MGIKIQTVQYFLDTKKSISIKWGTLRNFLLMIISLNTALDLKIFSPSEPIGIFIIFVGLIFTSMIFYIIYAVSTNKESLEDKKIRTKKEYLQKEKIGKLFPKKK